MLTAQGICTCGETFDGTALTEEQLAKLPPELVTPIRAVECTPLGVLAQVWWDSHMTKVPSKARDMHVLAIQVDP